MSTRRAVSSPGPENSQAEALSHPLEADRTRPSKKVEAGSLLFCSLWGLLCSGLGWERLRPAPSHPHPETLSVPHPADGGLAPPAPTWSHTPPGKVCRARREGGAATWGPS